MKMKEVRNLQSGDEVTWNDPVKEDFPEDDCSVTGVISNINIMGDIISIVWQHGGNLECYAEELS